MHTMRSLKTEARRHASCRSYQAQIALSRTGARALEPASPVRGLQSRQRQFRHGGLASMSLTLAALRELVELGLSPDQILRVAEAQDSAPTSGAERQRRYRANKKTRDVTRDVTNVTPDRNEGTSRVTSPRPVPRARVEDNPLSLVSSGKAKNLSEAKASSRCDDFAEFWSAWPEKKAVGAARKAYATARRKASAAEILAGISLVTETHAWQTGYRVHASKWLNDERWADPPEDHARAPPMTGGMVAAAAEELGYRMALEKLKERDERRNYQRDQGVIIPLPEARQIASR